MTGGPQTSWSKDNFVFQHRWLLKEAGLRAHRLQQEPLHALGEPSRFLPLVRRAGHQLRPDARAEQEGHDRFPAGRFAALLPAGRRTRLAALPEGAGSQHADAGPGGGLPARIRPATGGFRAAASRRRAFPVSSRPHPQAVGERYALCGLVDYGRAQGLEWWTNEQIYQWEMLRRGVQATFDSGNRFTLRAARPLREAMLSGVESTAGAAQPLASTARPCTASSRTWHGFEFDAVPVDVVGEVRVQTA